MASIAPRPVSNERSIPVWRRLPKRGLPSSDAVQRATIVVVGTGPVGLAAAIDLGQRGHDVIVAGKLDFVPAGSKAICYSKRSLDILDRLGVGDAAARKGVTWSEGKVFWQDRREPIYAFTTMPVTHQKMPGFVNLQQYHMEDLLIDRISQLPNVDLRPGHELVCVDTSVGDTVRLDFLVDDQTYSIESDWVIACDGSRSFVRNALGLDFDGRVFEDNFLIADIRMKRDHPAERWFWFDPPFNPGQSALMHKQPDNVWRLDFQIGWNVDREAAVQAENVERHVRAMLGEEADFEEDWYSVYTFQCRRMARFVHGRVIFAGDSAHLVSPFGARGCNGGFADVDNLGWKLDLILRGDASSDLLESYNVEATVTADGNLLASTRSTDFLTPKNRISKAFRDAVLELASEVPFARQFVNSGRLSVAIPYPDSVLNTKDEEEWGDSGVAPGHVALDAPFGDGWLLERIGGEFTVLFALGSDRHPPIVPGTRLIPIPSDTLAAQRHGLEPGAACLVRPDQYIAARWKRPSPDKVARAVSRAKGDVR
jgi:3-(3-hydroxy-phenyl)propionate hydroxylase